MKKKKNFEEKHQVFLGVFDGWGEGLNFQVHLKSSLCDTGIGRGKEVSDG